MIEYNLVNKIVAKQCCEKLVPVNLADQLAGALVAGDIGGVL